jgi:hypothetical protein
MYLQDILWSIGIWKNFSEDTVKHEDMFSLMMEGNVEEETAQEKRLRLAKEYLSQLEDKERELKDDKLIDHDAIAHRLRQEVLEGSGRLIKTVADSVSYYCWCILAYIPAYIHTYVGTSLFHDIVHTCAYVCRSTCMAIDSEKRRLCIVWICICTVLCTYSQTCLQRHTWCH